MVENRDDAVARLELTGCLPAARYIDSPNRDARPAGSPIDLLVIHNISLPPGVFAGDAIIDLFTNRLDASAHAYFADIAGLRVSSHLLTWPADPSGNRGTDGRRAGRWGLLAMTDCAHG